jgi:hypothetical protein
MSNITFTYGGATIAPAPKINIKSNIIYANDSAIGYEHEVTLNGQAIDKDVLTFGATISKAEEIRQTLSKNGSVLIVSGDGSDLIKAFGGVLTDLKFDSDNSFSKFANYSATIIFNELNILDDSFSCNSSQLSGYSQLIDINKYKIKEFTDSWTFNLDDGIYNLDTITQINNSQLNVSYKISAKGLSYFTQDGKLTLPWQQAKNFVQDRLFSQIESFYSKHILKIDTDSACSASQNLSNLYSNNNTPYIMGPILYSVYDETISCETSEAEGTFAATYNSILKFDNDDSDFSDKEAIHTFTKKISTSYEGKKDITSLSIEGTIQGLNLSQNLNFGGFSLPKNGNLLIEANNFTKLTNAKKVKDKIIKANEEDLADNFKDILKISDILSSLNCSDQIYPNSFSLTTDLFLGTINYSAQYSSDRLLASDSGNIVIYNTTIDVEKPRPVYAELPIPGGNYVIQDLSTVTNQKINISVNGRLKYDKCTEPSLTDIKGIIDEFTFPEPESSSFVLTNKNLLYNFPNHSFTMNVSYLCKSGCCPI